MPSMFIGGSSILKLYKSLESCVEEGVVGGSDEEGYADDENGRRNEELCCKLDVGVEARAGHRQSVSPSDEPLPYRHDEDNSRDPEQ